MHEHDRKNLEEFFKAIESAASGYQHSSVSYIAFRNGERFQLIQGRVQLQVVPVQVRWGYFESENVRAGIFKLAELDISPRGFIEELLTGTLRTPEGKLDFHPETDRDYSTYFNSHHQDGIAAQRRQIQLRVSGDRRPRVEPALLDWELKAAPTPYFNVQDLCDEFLVGNLDGDYVTVDLVAFNVAGIDSEASLIEGTNAKLAIVLAEGLSTEKAAIGFRVFGRNRVVKRGVLTGQQLTWEKIENLQRGIGQMEVPAGAVVDCIASFGGVAQNHFWIGDLKSSQNPFRSVHEAFDTNLEVLQEIISRAQQKGSNARELETAASWLLWMLGFSATGIGSTGKTSDAPDLVAATPLGNMIVVECTTGILKEGSKLPHLFQRSEKIRQRLAACGHQHLKVLPVIVTTKSRDEVKAELSQAHELGILVITSEGIPKLIHRTLLYPDPNALFKEAEESLRRLQNPPDRFGAG